jgi:hypothetical protein
METTGRSAIGPRLAVVLVLYFQSTRIFPKLDSKGRATMGRNRGRRFLKGLAPETACTDSVQNSAFRCDSFGFVGFCQGRYDIA